MMNEREYQGDWMAIADANQNGQPRKRKRRSRWQNEEEEKVIIPTVVPSGLSAEQEEQYIIQLQIEEISRRLRTGDLGIPMNPEDRSPSPEPIYNNEGKRLNTREYRTRKKLEEERHSLVLKACELNPDYKPPSDYKPPVIRVNDKVMIPQEEHPDINFVGLLIGPRGNTLKNLEKETGAKIIIRGKGSVKEGKIGRKDGQPLPGEDEPLHAYVTANNPEHVKKAVDMIKDIIRKGIEVPEGQNDLRRQQLRELALLNGTLRENDALGKLKQIQQAQTIVTNTIVCSLCGGTGHIAQDCKSKRPGDTFRGMTTTIHQTAVDKAKMDSEYMSLMAELGEGPTPSKHATPLSHVPSQRYQAPHPIPQWQRPPSITGPPPGVPPPSHPPPSMVGHPQQPPPRMQPPHQIMGVPPPSSGGPMAPPWSQAPPPQQIVNTHNSKPGSSMFRGPPPNMQPPPPPPAPSGPYQPSSTPHYPWQQQQQASQQSYGGSPGNHGNQGAPPWQQQSGQAPPPPPNSHQMGSMVPPPPPPGGHHMNPLAAPPPPPPGRQQHGSIPLGVPPPPPPN